MIHELDIRTAQAQRIGAGEITAKVVAHDTDYQTGDELRLFEMNDWGNRKYHYEDRDAKGRFANTRVEEPPVCVQITHVLPASQCDGLVEGKVLLSFVLLES